jgi:ribonuclease G
VRRNTGKKLPKKITAKDIPTIYPPGSEIMVQVSKGPIGTKGPRITTNISMPGRYLVLMPHSPQCGISRKIDDPKERDRLRAILNELDIPDGMGVIIRTVGAGQRSRFFVRDLALLLDQWREIERNMETQRAPYQLFEEPGLVERTVRDFLTDEVDAVICDDLASVERMQELVAQVSPRSRKRIQFYNEPQHIFDKYGVHKQVEKAFTRQVWLPCGGYIVIDETEALISVDVNTGRNKGGKEVEKTILQTNLEAVDEIARQMRLRNIGGLIVADLIDMKSRKDQQAVYLRMRQRLKRDKARTHVLPISQLGLMEMTRQRAAESMRMSQFDPCPHCEGRGLIKNLMTMSVELQRALHAVMRKHIDSVHEVKVIVNPELLDRLRTEDEELLIDIERRYGGRLSFKPDPSMHREKFILTDANTGEELKG